MLQFVSINLFLLKITVTNPRPVENDMERVQATLKQLVRDWSEDGAEVNLFLK